MSESLVGKLLVASSCVEDPMYARGVCLVVHQDPHRTIGVMLNRPLRPSADALLQMIQGPPGDDSGPVECNGSGRQDESRDERASARDLAARNLAARDLAAREMADRSGNRIVRHPSEGELALTQASNTLGMVHFGGPLSGPVVAIHGSSDLAEAETGAGIYVAAQKRNLEDLVRHKSSPYLLIVGHVGWDADQLDDEVQAGLWHVIPATAEAVFDGDADMWLTLVRRATARSVAQWLGTTDVPRADQLN